MTEVLEQLIGSAEMSSAPTARNVRRRLVEQAEKKKKKLVLMVESRGAGLAATVAESVVFEMDVCDEAGE